MIESITHKEQRMFSVAPTNLTEWAALPAPERAKYQDLARTFPYTDSPRSKWEAVKALPVKQCVHVDYDDIELRTRKDGRREKYFACVCWNCGASYRLRKVDIRKAEKRGSPCAHCQKSSAGKRGYESTHAKHSDEELLNLMAKTQSTRLSKPEQRVKEWLEDTGYNVQSQVVFHGPDRWHIIDFVVGYKFAVEVVGYWHKCKGEQRDQALAKHWTGTVLFIDADQVMRNPEETRQNLIKELDRG